MSRGFAGVGADALRSLAAALEDGRVGLPCTGLSVERFVAEGRGEAIAQELSAYADLGFEPKQLAATLRLVAGERDTALRASDRVELVWSGPELPGAQSRDTAVVVRELFTSARRFVLVSGYAIFQGKQVFRSLAENMDANPALDVRMFLNVERKWEDERADSELTRAFAERLRNKEWPGQRLPEVFYDPRSLSQEAGPRACLHAKCIVIDDSAAFVTSANFTEAAQERNIEAGVLLQSPAFARSLRAQFETLIQRGALKKLAGLG